MLRRHWRPLLMLHLYFTLLGFALLTPLFGLVLRGAVALSGSAAVVDQDIARVLLSPTGLTVGISLLSILIALAALELGALLALARAVLRGRELTPLAALRYTLGHALPLLRLALGLVLRLLLLVLPWVAVVGGLALWRLREHDINYYLAEHPPEFLQVLAVAVLLGLPLAFILLRKLLGWSLILPLMMFENMPPPRTFAASAALVDRDRGLCRRALLSWALLALGLLALPLLLLDLGMALVLAGGGTQLSTLALKLGLLTAVWTALNLLVAALNFGSFAFIIAHLHQTLSPHADRDALLDVISRESGEGRGWTSARAALALALVCAIAVGSGLWLLHDHARVDRVTIVAHRGAAGAAPENTLAAVNLAWQQGGR